MSCCVRGLQTCSMRAAVLPVSHLSLLQHTWFKCSGSFSNTCGPCWLSDHLNQVCCSRGRWKTGRTAEFQERDWRPLYLRLSKCKFCNGRGRNERKTQFHVSTPVWQFWAPGSIYQIWNCKCWQITTCYCMPFSELYIVSPSVPNSAPPKKNIQYISQLSEIIFVKWKENKDNTSVNS